MKSKYGILIICLLIIALGHTPGLATQKDYTGNDKVSNQVWKVDLTIDPMGNDSFSIRFPYPNYTWAGRWDTYETKGINIEVLCDVPGPFYWEYTYYNEGYSNQGVWIEVFYPPSSITFHYQIKQTATLRLPGHDYALQHFTNNGWMTGSGIVDVGAGIVGQDLGLAQQMEGDWDFRGYWKEPEQIVNWMRQNIAWSESDSHIIERASEVLAQGSGDCDGWAHAACAMLLKAGIAAKTVLVGAMTGYNATDRRFPLAQMHVCLAYWDGFGWILIDPYEASGFTFISRVILGADRDVSTVSVKTDPDYLGLYAQSEISCEEGNQSGSLHLWETRCLQYAWDILENYELPDPQNVQGTEPRSCIIPNIPTATDISTIPRAQLFVNYPNPFNPVTTFKFDVERDGRVKIDIFSVEGRLVATVVDAFMARGENVIEWKPNNLASGVYMVRFHAPDRSDTRKIVILK
jgi:hypothetical protein